MTNFHVGMRVRCVDDSGWEAGRVLWNYPVAGHEYTVREIINDEYPCLRLREITNRNGVRCGTTMVSEPYFRASRFRPVQYDTTKAVEEIKAMLPKRKELVSHD